MKDKLSTEENNKTVVQGKRVASCSPNGNPEVGVVDMSQGMPSPGNSPKPGVKQVGQDNKKTTGQQANSGGGGAKGSSGIA